MSVDRNIIQQQLSFTLGDFQLPQLGDRISGKVRDSYVQNDKRILITSDRLSAFDRILTTIPFKGQVLNKMASYWFRETRGIVPNHIISEPHPNIFISKQLEILPVEVIVRGYLAGSAWRDYEAGRPVSGIKLPGGMRKSERFQKPLLTPSTKAEHGKHDEPISSEEIVRSGLVEKKIWQEVSDIALKLFEFGSKRAEEHGLLLVDTKYEFGISREKAGNVQVVLADEIHTADSSRYWILDSYEKNFAEKLDPVMLDKEFVRTWLMDRGYMGDGVPPEMPDSFRIDTAERYIDVCERITGEKFQPLTGNLEAGIRSALQDFVKVR